MDMPKMHKMLEQYNAMTAEEQQAFFAMLELLNRMVAKQRAEEPVVVPTGKRLVGKARPSTRGRFTCPECKDVFRTKRGIGIHRGHAHKAAQKGAESNG